MLSSTTSTSTTESCTSCRRHLEMNAGVRGAARPQRLARPRRCAAIRASPEKRRASRVRGLSSGKMRGASKSRATRRLCPQGRGHLPG